MHPKTLKIIIGLTAVLVILAGLSIFKTPKYQTYNRSGQFVFPEFASQINQVAVITITRQDETITLTKNQHHWLIKEFYDYPAYPHRIANILMGIAQMKYLNLQTANPEKYKELGVEEPNQSDSIMLALQDQNQQTIAELIVSRKRFDFSTLGEGLYIRKPNEAQTWKTQSQLDVTGKVDTWIMQPIINLTPKEIIRIALTSPNGRTAIIAQNDEQTFVLENVSLEKNLAYQTKITALTNSLINLSFIEIEKDEPPFAYNNEQSYLIQINTASGLSFYFDVFPYKSGYWLKIKLEADHNQEAALQEFIKNHQIRYNNWIYRIPIDRVTPLMTDFN